MHEYVLLGFFHALLRFLLLCWHQVWVLRVLKFIFFFNMCKINVAGAIIITYIAVYNTFCYVYEKRHFTYMTYSTQYAIMWIGFRTFICAFLTFLVCFATFNYFETCYYVEPGIADSWKSWKFIFVNNSDLTILYSCKGYSIRMDVGG